MMACVPTYAVRTFIGTLVTQKLTASRFGSLSGVMAPSVPRVGPEVAAATVFERGRASAARMAAPLARMKSALRSSSRSWVMSATRNRRTSSSRSKAVPPMRGTAPSQVRVSGRAAMGAADIAFAPSTVNRETTVPCSADAVVTAETALAAGTAPRTCTNTFPGADDDTASRDALYTLIA